MKWAESRFLIFGFVILSGLFLLSSPSFGAGDTRKPRRGGAAGPKVEGMVFVKGGCFEMGDSFGVGSDSERPVHTVCVGDFYIGEHEVTQGEWQAVMESNPSKFSSCGDDCPVENVSWNDAQAFIRKMNMKNSMGYRLPTEAEWEYAARSGGRKEKYAGTSVDSQVGQYAWYEGNAFYRLHPVKQKLPNGLGLYDMSGNVWEWMSDCYDSAYYKKSPRDNPKGGSDCTYRVLRGGSWIIESWSLRVAFRPGFKPDERFDNLGLRLALPGSRP